MANAGDLRYDPAASPPTPMPSFAAFLKLHRTDEDKNLFHCPACETGELKEEDTGLVYACPTCNGTQRLTKVNIRKFYFEEFSKYTEELKKWNQYTTMLKRIKAKLTQPEKRFLNMEQGRKPLS